MWSRDEAGSRSAASSSAAACGSNPQSPSAASVLAMDAMVQLAQRDLPDSDHASPQGGASSAGRMQLSVQLSTHSNDGGDLEEARAVERELQQLTESVLASDLLPPPLDDQMQLAHEHQHHAPRPASASRLLLQQQRPPPLMMDDDHGVGLNFDFGLLQDLDQLPAPPVRTTIAAPANKRRKSSTGSSHSTTTSTTSRVHSYPSNVPLSLTPPPSAFSQLPASGFTMHYDTAGDDTVARSTMQSDTCRGGYSRNSGGSSKRYRPQVQRRLTDEDEEEGEGGLDTAVGPIISLQDSEPPTDEALVADRAVFILNGDSGTPCSLCGSKTPTTYYGLACHAISIANFDILAGRGWRRLGNFLFRPVPDSICCPRYNFRFSVDAKFQPMNRDVACLTNFNKFLATGEVPGSEMGRLIPRSSLQLTERPARPEPQHPETHDVSPPPEAVSGQQNVQGTEPTLPAILSAADATPSASGSVAPTLTTSTTTTGYSGRLSSALSLAELCHQQVPALLDPGASPRYEMELLLVPAHPSPEGYRLYVTHQVALHGRTASAVTIQKFEQEMCDTPLKYQAPDGEPGSMPFCGYGSFHAEFRLNGRLVGLQALDVLPSCICPTFFVFDPALTVLQFEHYARLRLVDLTMQIHAQCQQLRYYYGSRPLSPHHVSTMVLLENPTLEVQDQRGLSFQQFGAVKAQLLQTISDGPAAPAAASSPATMTLAPAAPLLPPLYGQTEEESDAGYASMRVADGAEVETLSTWQTRGKSNTTHVVHCAQAMGAKVCKNLTLVLNPLSV